MGYYDDDYALEQLRVEFWSPTVRLQEQITKSKSSFERWIADTLSAIKNFMADIGIAVSNIIKRLWDALFGPSNNNGWWSNEYRQLGCS
jgi:hypothetical protein